MRQFCVQRLDAASGGKDVLLDLLRPAHQNPEVASATTTENARRPARPGRPLCQRFAWGTAAQWHPRFF